MAGMAEDDLASQRWLRHAVAFMDGRRQALDGNELAR